MKYGLDIAVGRSCICKVMNFRFMGLYGYRLLPHGASLLALRLGRTSHHPAAITRSLTNTFRRQDQNQAVPMNSYGVRRLSM